MRRLRRTQSGHVARRLFMLFVLSAFVPLALIAALSLGEVHNLLLQQGEQRLGATAKAYGMTLYERLLVASDLAISTAARRPGALEKDSLAHRTFRWIALVQPSGQSLAVMGAPEPLGLSDEARARLAARKPVITVSSAAGVARVVLAVSPTGSPRDPIVMGEVNPEYLWGTADEMPASTEFCVVEDTTNTFLHCTGSVDPGAERTMLTHGRASLGSAAWERDGQTWRSIAWPQFMRAGFGTPDWVVMASQPERYQLARAIEFGRLYIPVVVLALLLVSWLTVRQASHIVRPLARLAERARGIAQNDFKSRVEIGREDEFGDVAAAFDNMSQKLGRQFASLNALSEIDRLILSTVDTTQVLRTVMQRLAGAVRADAVTVTLFDHDNPGHARTTRRAASKCRCAFRPQHG